MTTLAENTIVQMQKEIIDQYKTTLEAHQYAQQKMLEYIKSIYELLLTDMPGSKELAITHLGKLADKVQQTS